MLAAWILSGRCSAGEVHTQCQMSMPSVSLFGQLSFWPVTAGYLIILPHIAFVPETVFLHGHSDSRRA
ncbi:MAG: hypothetical protein JWL61_3947 [Gemmatimonadetes bacterium]|jgi:hypothetical protein|nr:hypothetical protein [Gemmatimonadota bacterium]